MLKLIILYNQHQFSTTFHDQHLNSITFQAWKMKEITLHDFPGFPWSVQALYWLWCKKKQKYQIAKFNL